MIDPHEVSVERLQRVSRSVQKPLVQSRNRDVSAAIGQVTPGPVFTTATFIGYLLPGLTGAAVATTGIFLPALLGGVIVASLPLMAVVAWQLGRASVTDLTTALLATGSLILLLRFRLNSAWLVLIGAVAGLVAYTLRGY